MLDDFTAAFQAEKRTLTFCLLALAAPIVVAAPKIEGCPAFPADSAWNIGIDSLPRHPDSDAFVATMGASRGVHPDFGTVYQGAPIGIPYVAVAGTQPKVAVAFDYGDESDAGPYPIPANPPIEGGPQSDGDRHILVVDRDNCILYELFSAYPTGNGTWRAGSGSIYSLRSNELRPDGWTSADAAGLPILPGLVRYDEVAAGEIAHALRFTAPQTRHAYLWPARHYASSLSATQYPPMGLRMRLRGSFDISGFSAPVQVILRALKKYGMFLADNGSAWFISGVPDSRWNDDVLVSEFARVKGPDFEAVDASALMRSANSAATTASIPADLLAAEYYNSILDHYFMTSDAAERQSVETGGAGPGWTRTTASAYRVWSSPGTALTPVCRFYGNPQIGANGRRIGPNSHFYTIDPAECAAVKLDAGWVYEGTAFHAVRLDNGACPGVTRPLYRAYNNGFPAKDANHRYATELAILEAMRASGWSVEGAAMCVQ